MQPSHRPLPGPSPLFLLAVLQLLLGARVLARLRRTAGGERISRAPAATPPAGRAVDAAQRVSVVLPVLNEARRVGPCLEGLLLQEGEVAEINVVDGGSVDDTPEVVAALAARDARVRLTDASPVPADWNGKAWGLQVGLEGSDAACAWLLTVDADVCPQPGLARALVAHALKRDLPALSVATAQALSGAGEAVVHPAMLTTLVYRFGSPGGATRRPHRVQANGQCALYRRDVLLAAGGFAPARASLCEDVTLARHLARAGHAVGFYESDTLVSVRMYGGAAEAWRSWPRSLPLRDQYAGWRAVAGLLEVTLVQALPLPLVLALLLGLLAGRAGRGAETPGAGGAALALAVNGALATVRLGILAGTARAYRHRPWTYWLSPVCDVPVALALWRSLLRRDHTWRGRRMVSLRRSRDEENGGKA